MTQCVDDYTSLYEAYMTKADEIATPWAASMKEYVEMYYIPHSLPAMAMYEKFDSLCALYNQLEYMETNTPSTSTHAASQPTIDALTAQITSLTAQITTLQATNTQLLTQSQYMSAATNTLHEQMRQKDQTIFEIQTANAQLGSNAHRLKIKLAQMETDHATALRAQNEEIVKSKETIRLLNDEIQQSKITLTQLSATLKAKDAALATEKANNTAAKEQHDAKVLLDQKKIDELQAQLATNATPPKTVQKSQTTFHKFPALSVQPYENKFYAQPYGYTTGY
jgi:septal ring factor EnvC (AmiA/AmiB activator)